MSREEAIKYLNEFILFKKISNTTEKEAVECFKLAIEALKQQPSERTEERTETHTCDCISRQAVLDALHRYFADGFDSDRWWNSTHVLDAINKAPSVNPQPKEEGTRGDIPLQQSVPKMPQPKERTEERTETHTCDYNGWLQRI